MEDGRVELLCKTDHTTSVLVFQLFRTYAFGYIFHVMVATINPPHSSEADALPFSF
jgi:hypothetical protein